MTRTLATKTFLFRTKLDTVMRRRRLRALVDEMGEGQLIDLGLAAPGASDPRADAFSYCERRSR